MFVCLLPNPDPARAEVSLWIIGRTPHDLTRRLRTRVTSRIFVPVMDSQLMSLRTILAKAAGFVLLMSMMVADS